MCSVHLIPIQNNIFSVTAKCYEFLFNNGFCHRIRAEINNVVLLSFFNLLVAYSNQDAD